MEINSETKIIRISMQEFMRKSLHSGVICLDSASSHLRMSKSFSLPTQVYSDTLVGIDTNILKVIPTKPNLVDTYAISGDLYITNEGRTVCELLLSNSNIETTLQCIDWFLDHRGQEELNEYLTRYGAQAQYDKIIPYLSDIWEC